MAIVATSVSVRSRLLLLAPRLLPLLLLSSQPYRVAGCSEGAWSNGYLPSSYAMSSVTVASSCSCCGLCHQTQGCASFSFSSSSGSCSLYSIVAGYDTLVKDDGLQHFLMPGRSRQHQFCRADSDCVESGDACRARVCTSHQMVTCAVIRHTFGAQKRFGSYVRMFGWVENEEVRFFCYMGENTGATRVLQMTRGFQFNKKTVERFNTYLEEGQPDSQSLLFAVETIRKAGSAANYKIKIQSSREVEVLFFAPRDTPVLGTSPRMNSSKVTLTGSDVSNAPEDWTPSLPYRSAASSLVLLSVGEIPPENQDANQWLGQLVRTDGRLGNWLGKKPQAEWVRIYMYE